MIANHWLEKKYNFKIQYHSRRERWHYLTINFLFFLIYLFLSISQTNVKTRASTARPGPTSASVRRTPRGCLSIVAKLVGNVVRAPFLLCCFQRTPSDGVFGGDICFYSMALAFPFSLLCLFFCFLSLCVVYPFQFPKFCFIFFIFSLALCLYHFPFFCLIISFCPSLLYLSYTV